MQPQLAALVEELEVAQARVRRLTVDVPDDRWAARRQPDAWSVAECITHLNLTARAYLPLLNTGLSKTPVSSNSVRRYRRDFIGLQDEQIATVQFADGRPLADIWVTSPFDSRVRYNAYSCLVLLPRHQRRHLDQAECM